MINEDRTLKDFGYVSTSLTSGSSKKVWRRCKICGKEKIIRFQSYRDLCISCVQIGKLHSNETKRKMSKNNSRFMLGKHLSEKTKQILSEKNSGENHPMWGKHHSEEYPRDFKTIKIYIRKMYNNCDFLTGEHKNSCNKGEELSVHHIDYNKQNTNVENLIPLCRSNHMRTNYNREFWQGLFLNILYNVAISNQNSDIESI